MLNHITTALQQKKKKNIFCLMAFTMNTRMVSPKMNNGRFSPLNNNNKITQYKKEKKKTFLFIFLYFLIVRIFCFRWMCLLTICIFYTISCLPFPSLSLSKQFLFFCVLQLVEKETKSYKTI